MDPMGDDHLPSKKSHAEARRTPLLPAASMGGFGTRGTCGAGATAGSAGVGGRVASDLQQLRDVVLVNHQSLIIIPLPSTTITIYSITITTIIINHYESLIIFNTLW